MQTFAAKVFSTSTVSGDTGTTLVTKDYVDSGDGSSINTILVTAVAVAGQGNRYFLDGVQQANAVLQPGFTYRFDQSATTPSPGNGPHPLRFSITPDGTHNSGVEYTTGVTVVGTPGSAGAYTQIITTQATPVTLYYYCIYHSGMGGAATIRIIQTNGTGYFANNVGINATDPVKTLDVRGNLAISNNASSYWYIDRNDATGSFDLNTDTNVTLFSVSISGLGSFVNTSIGDKLLLAGDNAGSARDLMFNCSTTTNQGDTWDIDVQ